jgi:Undecaprenyl-phosphate glucose phosphotransferase
MTAAGPRNDRFGDGDWLPAGAHAVARTLRRPSLAPGLVAALAMLVDGAGFGLGLWFGAFASSGSGFDPTRAAMQAMLEAAAAVLVLRMLGLYRLAALRRLKQGSLVSMAFGLLLASFGGFSAAEGVVLAAFVLPSRALSATLAAAVLDFGLTERRAVIVGGGERAERVMAALAECSDSDIRVCGIFDDRDDSRSPPVVTGVPKLGTLDRLVAFARAAEIDMLIVTLPLTAEQRIRSILKMVEVLPLDVRLSDFSADLTFSRHGTPMASSGLIHVMSRPIRGGKFALKRTLDVVGAAMALILLAPILVLTAAAVRLDSPGPILFRQPRHGYNHRPVDVWKFRSMHAADCDPAARRIVVRGDPRVTRVGRVIRRWSLDELPQLFNVLKGDLSLVGPRPHALAAMSSRQESFEAIVDGYAARHKVRPGITGWAQVHGWRGEIDDPEALRRRVEHDLYYIENWSVWLDLYVLVVTPLRLITTRNAY